MPLALPFCSAAQGVYMSLTQEQLRAIDLSILQLQLFSEHAPEVPEALTLSNNRNERQRKRAFWGGLSSRGRWFSLRSDWTPTQRIKDPTAALPIREYKLMTDERFEELQDPYSIVKEPKPVNVDWKIMDQLSQCTPQFFLRNIGRVERSIDLDDPPQFNVEKDAKLEAIKMIEEGRKAEIPKPEFADVWTTAFISDVNVFLEETLYLCPWEEIPSVRGRNAELKGTSWDPEYSRAQITRDLANRAQSGTLFVFARQGKHTEVSLQKKRRSKARVIEAKKTDDAAPADDTAMSTEAIETLPDPAVEATPNVDPPETIKAPTPDDDDGNDRMG